MTKWRCEVITLAIMPKNSLKKDICIALSSFLSSPDGLVSIKTTCGGSGTTAVQLLEHCQEYRCQQLLWLEKSEKLKLQSNFSGHILLYGFPQERNYFGATIFF